MNRNRKNRVGNGSMKKGKQQLRQLNNAGFTLVEMLVSFALLTLFMVAATRTISYTIGIYYTASGSMNGMQVSNIISNKIVGQMEGASSASEPRVTKGEDGIDAFSFIDATGSAVTISASEQIRSDGTSSGIYMNIAYDDVSEGSIHYDAVDWRFDEKAYMGYTVKTLTFDSPGDDYPDNVVKMTLVLHSGKYGDYTTVNYIKCVNVDKINFE